MKLTTTALSTLSVICSANLAPSTAQLLMLILDRTARGLRCYTADIAEELGRDRNKTLQIIQNLRAGHWLTTSETKLNGKRTLDSQPTGKSLALMQRILELGRAVEQHQSGVTDQNQGPRTTKL